MFFLCLFHDLYSQKTKKWDLCVRVKDAIGIVDGGRHLELVLGDFEWFDGAERHRDGHERARQQYVGEQDAQVASIVVETFEQQGAELLRVQPLALQLRVLGLVGVGGVSR